MGDFKANFKAQTTLVEAQVAGLSDRGSTPLTSTNYKMTVLGKSNTVIFYLGVKVMEKYFSIGETARINNVSIQALRLYDKMGLLKPAYTDLDSKYRYYTIDQFFQLDLIRYLKYIGAPLKELNDVLHDKDINVSLAFIKKQQQVIEKEIKRLKNVSKAIGDIENKIKYSMEVKTNEIYFREIPKRFIINYPLDKKDEVKDVEIKMRKFDKILEENEIMFEGEMGWIFDLESFLNGEKINCQSVYSTLSYNNSENKNINIEEIPAGRFICISYLNKCREKVVEKLRKYIKERNINPLGIGLEVQLLNTLEPWENQDVMYELEILI